MHKYVQRCSAINKVHCQQVTLSHFNIKILVSIAKGHSSIAKAYCAQIKRLEKNNKKFGFVGKNAVMYTQHIIHPPFCHAVRHIFCHSIHTYSSL